MGNNQLEKMRPLIPRVYLIPNPWSMKTLVWH